MVIGGQWNCSLASRLPVSAQHASSMHSSAHQSVVSASYSKEARFPSILTSFDMFSSLATGKRLVVFLDYDGTLTPIVSNPDMALMSQSMRTTVRRVGQTFPTAIISGRGRSKVEKFVQLDELFYAGSHGLDIRGPLVHTGTGELHEALPLTLESGLLAMMSDIKREADEAVSGVAGATVEDNTYCVSVHFRNCAPEDWPKVQTAVQSIIDRHMGVHMTRGRKVLEIRPCVDWDKGKALLHLLRALGLDAEEDVTPIYIGDDRTDEDAFRVLQGQGIGILVSNIAKPTAAQFVLSDPEEVGRFLDRIVDWGTSSEHNAWRSNPACVGWAPVHPDSYPEYAPKSTMHHVSSLSSVSTHLHLPQGSVQPDACAESCEYHAVASENTSTSCVAPGHEHSVHLTSFQHLPPGSLFGAGPCDSEEPEHWKHSIREPGRTFPSSNGSVIDRDTYVDPLWNRCSHTGVMDGHDSQQDVVYSNGTFTNRPPMYSFGNDGIVTNTASSHLSSAEMQSAIVSSPSAAVHSEVLYGRTYCISSPRRGSWQ